MALLPNPFAGFPNIYCPYVDTVGKNESRIAEYVRNQLKENEMGEQLRIPSNSPFAGGK